MFFEKQKVTVRYCIIVAATFADDVLSGCETLSSGFSFSCPPTHNTYHLSGEVNVSGTIPSTVYL